MRNERLITAAGAGLDAETFGDPDDPAILLLADPGGPAGRWPDEYCARLATGLRFVIRCTASPGGGAADPAAAPAALLTALDTGPAHIVAAPWASGLCGG